MAEICQNIENYQGSLPYDIFVTASNEATLKLGNNGI
jgi:hypothetical protein